MTMKTLKLALCAATMSAGFGMLAYSPAMAQAAIMKECAAEFQAARAAGTTADQTWTGYLASCKLRKEAPVTPVAAPAPAPVKPLPPVVAAPKPVPPIVAAPAPKPLPPVVAAPAPKPLPPVVAAPAPQPLPPIANTTVPPEANPKPRSAGQLAFYERERKCGAYWKENKVALKEQTPGLKWPQFLSSCNAQLKAANP